MLTMWIRDQTALFVQSDLDLHCPRKLPVSSTGGKELNAIQILIFVDDKAEKIVIQEENTGYQHFPFFHNIYKFLPFSKSFKLGSV